MRAFRTWALLISLAGHLGLVAWLLHKRPEQGAVSAGLGGIEVAMAPSGGAPGATVPTARPVAAAAVPVETATPVDQAQPVEAVEPPPPPVAAVETELPPVIGSTAGEEVAAVEPERAETRTTGPATEAGTVKAEVAEIPAPEGQAVATEPDQVRPIDGPGAARGVEPEVVQTQEMRPAPTPAAKPVIRPRLREVAQRPPPLPQPATVPPAPTPSALAEVQTAAPAPTTAPPGASGLAGNTRTADAGSDDGPAGGGTPGPSPDYVSLLQAWLARHREYPRTARLRRQEGTALLRFVMDRQGRVLSYRIERSSGVPALDRAVEEMLARASPLPSMPPETRNAQLELVVPVRFELR